MAGIDSSELQQNMDPSEFQIADPVRVAAPVDPAEISAILDKPIDGIEKEQETGIPFSEAEALSKINTGPLITDTITNKTTSELFADYQERVAKDRELRADTKPRLDNYLMAKSPDVSAYETRVARRMNMAYEEYLAAQKEANGSMFSDTVDFIDRYLFRYLSGIGFYEQLVSRRAERESQDITQLVLTDMTDETFREQIRANIASRKSEGFYLSNNVFSIDEQLRALESFGGQNATNEANFDQFASAMDAVLATMGVKSSTLKNLLSNVGIVQKVGSIRGPLAGTKVLNNILTAGRAPTDNTLSVLSQRYLDLDSITPMSVIDQSAPVQRAVTNELLKKLELMNSQGLYGRAINPEKIRDIAELQAQEVLSRLNLEHLDINLQRIDNLDNYIWSVELGKTKGGLYSKTDTGLRAAEKRAMQFEGRVIEVPEGGYKIRIDRNVNLSGYTEGYDLLKERTGLLGNIFGSASRREQTRLSALANQAEQASALIQKEFTQFRKDISRLPTEDHNALDEFFTLYRDGLRSSVREAPDVSDFEAWYTAHRNAMPSQRVKDAYTDYVRISDAAWKLAADRRLKQAIARGYESATDISGFKYLLRPIQSREELAADDLVYDVISGKHFQPDQLPPESLIFKTNDVIEGTIYITNPRRQRAIVHSDVLPYNFGGPRTNPDLRMFLLEESETVLRNGKVVADSPKVILGARTEKEIRDAFESIQRIRDAHVDFKKGKISKQELDELIVANNTFNPQIENIDEFLAWADDVGYTEGKLAWKIRNEVLAEGDVGFNLPTGAKTPDTPTLTDIFRIHRKDTPIYQYHVGNTVNPDPLVAITDQFAGEANFLANRQYLQAAMEGWVKKAAGVSEITLPSKSSNDFIYNFMHAVIKDNPVQKDAKRLQAARNRVLRRLNQPTWASAQWDRIIDNISATLHDQGFPKVARWADVLKKDPSNQLLSFGFYTKFGFFNWDQFILQSVQMSSIMAVSPVNGTKAASMAMLLRLAAGADNEMAKIIAKRLAKFHNIPEQDLENIIRYIKESGRLEVSNELIELGGNQRIVTHSMLGKALDNSTFFFKEGERHARVTAMATAFLDYKQRFPKAELFSDHMRAWMARRDAELSFNMTGSGRNALQSNTILKVATQWTSYTLRSMESVFFNKELSFAERVRLGVYLLPMWGLTGLGIGGSAAWVASSLGFDLRTEEGKNAYTFMKYGVLDGLMNWMGLDNTAAALRIAPLGGISQTLYDWSTNSMLETFAGPSGTILYNTTVPFFDVIGNVMHGRLTSAGLDVERLARNISTVNKLVIAGLIYRDKMYRGSTGAVVPTTLGAQEFVTNVILGFPLKEVQEFYDAKSAVWWENQAIESIGKGIQTYVDRGLREVADGNTEVGYGLLQEAAEMTSLLQPHERRIIMQKYWSTKDQDLLRIYRGLIQTGQEEEAQAFLGQIQPYLDKMTGTE